MLSYQHSYHAGSLADVHKHALWAALIDFMVQKGKLMTVMETHAGRGIYDLSSEEAQKTREAKQGIDALFKTEGLKGSPYFECIEAIHQELGPTFYPGSPYIAASLLTAGDTLQLMELHPQEFEHLKRVFKPKGARCHMRDGYEGVLALSPPPARRGIVFIDPSYEIKTEYMHIADFVKKLKKRWPEVTIVLWYPILAAKLHQPMCNALLNQGHKDVWMDEWLFKANEQRMLGTGMMILNTPYGVGKTLDTIVKTLRKQLG